MTLSVVLYRVNGAVFLAHSVDGTVTS